ncbi:hypothetical protein HNQ92_004465 [Rhabdobacter roseus]|uniref:Cycloisomerase n=1 Tax=Rhabdobacter roseus TaxID=1655419 RepID=A0A840TTS7_9BACT|nr:hypothetical protein [Rhabdobacter roseus]MBB5286305.1 hypothetical protein [Rhabdobacter roseus]
MVPFVFSAAFAQSTIREFQVEEAKQAVAVDARHFYVINNSTIRKYRKDSGELVATWDGTKQGIVHLNSGVVLKGKLYCANSNYPDQPMTSSVEIFEVGTLRHTGTHSFGIAQHGSLTWLDQKDGYWYVGFAEYSGRQASAGRDGRWTSLVKYDRHWRQLEAWVYPKNILDRFAPMSNSGGTWGRDGLLYITGHDHPEVYVLKLPASGYTLDYLRTIPLPIAGQGIALDRTEKNKRVLWGIHRAKRTVFRIELE